MTTSKEMTIKEAEAFLKDHLCCQQCLKQAQATCDAIAGQGDEAHLETYKLSRPDCIKALLKAYEPIVVDDKQEEEYNGRDE